jgi:hypothetical protein
MFSNGQTISETFVFDDNPATFQTFSPTGFMDLLSVTLQADESGVFAIDNLVVPEPNLTLFVGERSANSILIESFPA